MNTVVKNHIDLLDLAAEVARGLESLVDFEANFRLAVEPYQNLICTGCRRPLIERGPGERYEEILIRARQGADSQQVPQVFADELSKMAQIQRRIRQI